MADEKSGQVGRAVGQVVRRRPDQVSYNCLDAKLDIPHTNKAAIVWEGEPGDVRVLTYRMLPKTRSGKIIRRLL